MRAREELMDGERLRFNQETLNGLANAFRGVRSDVETRVLIGLDRVIMTPQSCPDQSELVAAIRSSEEYIVIRREGFPIIGVEVEVGGQKLQIFPNRERGNTNLVNFITIQKADKEFAGQLMEWAAS
jgi:hypothetical protein